ncbi:hypothetical protein [Cryobacterium sp. PAMC25264]|uniref:hypothetical protein n=1 Tax=Cryobacterium sp. PAMC25264 TaxID=2861288 RepID=UPI001C629890|nr:hypothetical protein [Cryobacterium sp. PAMC25264]QYF74874.1 hypothetical protein KY500_06995 [Cryobacterium sp. PAMC25264]
MDVLLDGGRTAIVKDVFASLLGNSVVNGRVPFLRALETSEISFSDLVELARKAEIPYPLFFAPLELVHAQLGAKTEKLLQGVAPGTFTVSSRTSVELRDVELIVKDLLRKQALVRKHDPSLVKNPIAGLLRREGRTPKEEAKALLDALGLDLAVIRGARTKAIALDLIIERLESNQVLVSRSVRGFMPQLLQVKFSGMTVRDSKVPYIFLAGGDHGDDQEPIGRQIFTLVLMAVLVGRGIFAPVTYDASSTAPQAGREYDIVGEILMPADEVKLARLNTLEEIKAAADSFQVTPSAMAVRAMRLGLMTAEVTRENLRELAAEYRNRTKPQPRSPKPVNAIRKYSGRELTSRLLAAVDARKLTEREFCRVVCLNRIKPSELHELRAALR